MDKEEAQDILNELEEIEQEQKTEQRVRERRFNYFCSPIKWVKTPKGYPRDWTMGLYDPQPRPEPWLKPRRRS